jgi:DNA-binding NtrC family response regulator
VPAAAAHAITQKILIVDDDESVTQTFASMLRLEGYQVRTAVSAENGLRVAEKSTPTRSSWIFECRSSTGSGSCGACVPSRNNG